MKIVMLTTLIEINLLKLFWLQLSSLAKLIILIADKMELVLIMLNFMSDLCLFC